MTQISGLEFRTHPYAGRGKAIMLYCHRCKREHRVTSQPCPSCSGRGGSVMMPSDGVLETCRATYECDGCDAYRDHINPF